ncbi:ABC transporter [Botrytis cinerea]
MLQIFALAAAIGAGTTRPLMTIFFASLVNDFNDRNAIQTSELKSRVNRNVRYFVCLFAAQFLLTYIFSSTLSIVAARISRNLRLSYLRAIVRHDQSYWDTAARRSAANDISNEATQIKTGLSETSGLLWRLTLVMPTAIVTLFSGFYLISRAETRTEGRISLIYSDAAALLEEVFSSIQTVMAMGAEAKLSKRYGSYLDKARISRLKNSPVSGVKFVLSYFVLLSAYALAFWYGVKLVVSDKVRHSGNVVIVILCVNMSTNALRLLLPSWTTLTQATASARSILLPFLHKPTIDPFSREGKFPDEFLGRIEICNASFSYPSKPSIKTLDDVSIIFERGKTTAVTGPSGCGKSTIINLLERNYDLSSGRILLDGEDIKDLNIGWLRCQIGLVQQDPILFNESIFQNVANGIHSQIASTLSQDHITELVHQACKDANIHDFISQLPQGYETIAGDRGSSISGGERQRIAIARAIISDPPILLLDEATSALDAKSEGVVQATLEKLSLNRTTIVVSHKLSTIQKADKIVLIKDGRVVEEGTHADLCSQGGAYQRLVETQSVQSAHMKTIHKGEIDNLVTDLDRQEFTDEKAPMSSTHTSIDIPLIVQNSTSPQQKSLVRCLGMIMRDLRHYRPIFIIGTLACIVSGGIYPSQSIVFAKSVTVFEFHGDSLKHNGDFWALMLFVLALGVCLAFGAMGTIFSAIAAIVGHHYRGSYFAEILAQDADFFTMDDHSPGSLTAQLTSRTQQLENLMSTSLGLILVVIVNLVASCVLSLLESWKLALVAIFGSLPVIILAGYLHVRLESTSKVRDQILFHESASFISEVTASIKTIASLTMEKNVCEKLDQKLQGPTNRVYRETFTSMLLFAFSQSASLLGMALAFWYGGHLLADREINGYELFVIFLAIVSGGEAAGSFFAQSNNIVQAHSAANHILNMKTTPTSHISDIAAIPPPSPGDTIDFSHVSFHYASRPESLVLKNLSFKARYGENLAIVGASGSGKSTVIALLERFYKPTQGVILFRGMPLDSTDMIKYRSLVSLVSQQTCLYQGSVRQNILLGIPNDESISEDVITRACKDADIHEFITSLPQGYETQIGNRGLSLSGGQRQRIAIARALIRDPAVLLLDEATSALDVQSERQVQQALNNAMKGRITITVAHRLSTIRSANQILVLSQGELKEVGTHDELFAKKGFYFDMCQMQAFAET